MGSEMCIRDRFKEWKHEDDIWYSVEAATVHSPVYVIHGIDEAQERKVSSVVPYSQWSSLFSIID